MQPPQPRLSVREFYVKLFKALADSTRLQMLELIAGAEEYACTTLETELPISKSTISYHVKILREAGLISVRREGKWFFYKANRDVLDYYLPGLLTRLEESAPPQD